MIGNDVLNCCIQTIFLLNTSAKSCPVIMVLFLGYYAEMRGQHWGSSDVTVMRKPNINL